VDVHGDRDLLHTFPHFYDLSRTRGGVHLQLATFGPCVRLIVVGDVAHHQAAGQPVDDDADVVVDANRPEVAVLRALQAMELHARIARIELEVEGCVLYGLLLVAGQAREAVVESVREPEGGHDTLNTFMTSSPRWLMTFTATRPLAGFGNGRDTSRLSDDHASSLISAFSVVLSAP
jgi:hypothetical protein